MGWTADVFDCDVDGERRALRVEVQYRDQPVMWISKVEGVVKIEYVGDGSAWVMDAGWLVELLTQIEKDPSITD